MNNLKKIFNKEVGIFTFVIWTIINITRIQDIYFSTILIVTNAVVKVLHLIFMYFIFLKLFNLVKNRKEENGKIEFRTFIIYFGILFLCLIITWPGTWSWDDITILNRASSLDFTPWQHFFSGLFHTLCLQTIPIAAGVIFIQILIASLIVGYVASEISSIYGKDNKQKTIISICILIISLFPPIILYILSGFRMGIYAFFELLVITKLLVIYKKDEKIKIQNLLEISFFIIIISCWRTEAIYYPIVVFILFLILGKKVISRKIALIFLITTMIINYGIGKYNNSLIGNNNYSLTATMNEVVSLVRVADNSNEEELEKINKIIDIDFVLNNPNYNGEACYWTPGVVRNYSDDEYKDYLKSYAKLTLKYPTVTINSMWGTFYDTVSGDRRDNKQRTRTMIKSEGIGNTLNLFDENDGTGELWSNIKSRYKNPINIRLRNSLIMLLGGIDREYNITILHRLFWNCIIPFILIIASLIYRLIKKDWYMVVLILLIMARVPLLFATAPAPYFMYYLSVYLCSYILSFITIFEIISKYKNQNRKDKVKDENKKEYKIKVKRIIKQFLSFLLVSGVGWLIDFTIYFILTKFIGLKVIYANILSSIPAITYVFLMSNKKIFKNTESKLSIKIKYLIYFGYQLILLFCISALGEFLYSKLLNIVAIPIILNNLKIVIKILITPITMTLNFIVLKNIIEKL